MVKLQKSGCLGERWWQDCLGEGRSNGDRNVPYIDRVMVIWVHTFIKTQTMWIRFVQFSIYESVNYILVKIKAKCEKNTSTRTQNYGLSLTTLHKVASPSLSDTFTCLNICDNTSLLSFDILAYIYLLSALPIRT